MSISLDGFIAGPNDSADNSLGDGGSRLFDWWTAGDQELGGDDRFRPPERSRSVVEEMFDCGAIITGRRTFDIACGWGGHHPVGAPFFLLTHEPPGEFVGPGTEGTVATDGIESALAQAQAVAGDRAVAVGAANVAPAVPQSRAARRDPSQPRSPHPRWRCSTHRSSRAQPGQPRVHAGCRIKRCHSPSIQRSAVGDPQPHPAFGDCPQSAVPGKVTIATTDPRSGRRQASLPGLSATQASRVIIRHAPRTVQATSQATMTQTATVVDSGTSNEFP